MTRGEVEVVALAVEVHGIEDDGVESVLVPVSCRLHRQHLLRKAIGSGKRAVIDRIGVMNRRYFGYFGDIDYVLRAQRAGFRLVCAKGAWLHHVGAGYYKEKAARTGEKCASIHSARMQVVGAAYRAFRENWDASLPAEYPGASQVDFASLRRAQGVSDYEPAVSLEDAPCDLL